MLYRCQLHRGIKRTGGNQDIRQQIQALQGKIWPRHLCRSKRTEAEASIIKHALEIFAVLYERLRRPITQVIKYRMRREAHRLHFVPGFAQALAGVLENRPGPRDHCRRERMRISNTECDCTYRESKHKYILISMHFFVVYKDLIHFTMLHPLTKLCSYITLPAQGKNGRCEIAMVP